MIKEIRYLKRKNSIFLKTFISYMIIFTIPLFIFGITIYKWVANIIREQTVSTYVTALEDIKSDMDRSFESMGVFAVQLSYIPWVSKYMYMENNNFNYDHINVVEMVNAMSELNIYNATYELVDDIAIYFNGKDTVLSSRGKDSLDRYFQDIIRYKNMESPQWNTILSQYNGQRVMLPQDVFISNQPHRLMTYIQSLPPGDKSLNATLLLFINENKLIDKLKKTSILKNSSVYVIDDNNNFVTGINMHDEIKSFIRGQKYDNISGNIVSDMKFMDNIKYSLFYLKSSNNGWKYIAAVPIGIVMSKINFIRILTTILSIFYLCIGLLLSYSLTMKNYKPLANIIDMISAKWFHEKKVNNEFEFLEDSIYSMITNINRSESENHLYRPLARNTCLTKLLKNETDVDDELFRIMGMLDITFSAEYLFCAVILLRIDNYLSEEFQSNMKMEMSCFNTLIYFVEFDDRNKAVIFNPQKPDIQRDLMNILITCLNNSSLKYRAVGVGRVYNNINNLYKTYNEAVVAIDYRFISSDEGVIFVEDIDFNNDWIGYIPEEEQIINSIKVCDVNNALSLSKEVISRNTKGRQLSLDMIRYLCYIVSSAALKASEEMNICSPSSTKLKKILQMDTIDEMILSIETVFSETCALISREKESHNSQLIQDIIGHINNQYTDHNISLTQVAEAFNISPSYLSRFFKNQLGCNFVDYLNKRRIEASQSLLMGNATISQVALKVGFDNDITFRRLFKKYTGETPSSFKNK